ncbi:LuxR C-terminal-related transcriptional regulator [Alicyclobacillus contaminans]|uniref:LuxR C-terminal-related transcriptional regulator n=1 Tax=Alicyclobacillus contaminans TaxID=392016 RepID=UPI00041BB8C2|nr:response regulator transcription factor [Alicyclobacillus contaminans]
MARVVRVFSWLLPPLFNLGLRTLLATRNPFVYSGAYQELGPLLRAFADTDRDADVLLLEYQHAYTDYPQLLQRLRAHNPMLRVLFILPNTFDEEVLRSALRSGGDGYLLQCVEESVLLDALDNVVRGDGYLDSQMTPAVLEELRKPLHAMQALDVQVPLTERERMLVQLAADGLSNGQISQVMGLAEKTVRNVWSSLFDKVGYNDRTQTVLWAIRTGQAELR